MLIRTWNFYQRNFHHCTIGIIKEYQYFTGSAESAEVSSLKVILAVEDNDAVKGVPSVYGCWPF